MITENFDPKQLAHEYDEQSPAAIIKLALESFENIAISFSGAEDVVLVDIATKINPDVKVFSLDTGRLHAETYRFIEQVREHYSIEIDVLSPDAKAVQDLVRTKGLYSFYRDGHKECCSIRKVIPLRRHLAGLDAWIQDNVKTKARILEILYQWWRKMLLFQPQIRIFINLIRSQTGRQLKFGNI